MECAKRSYESSVPASGFSRVMKPSESPSQRELSGMIQKDGRSSSVVSGKDVKLSVGYYIVSGFRPSVAITGYSSNWKKSIPFVLGKGYVKERLFSFLLY